MIFDRQVNLDRYRGISDDLDHAISFLQTTDLAALAQGTIQIDGNRVFVNHFAYETCPLSAESLFEDHKQYLDLHIVLAGQERMAVAPVGALNVVEHREAEDSTMYRGESENGYLLPISVGDFALVFPGEGHMARLTHDNPSFVDKLVFKIAVTERKK